MINTSNKFATKVLSIINNAIGCNTKATEPYVPEKTMEFSYNNLSENHVPNVLSNRLEFLISSVLIEQNNGSYDIKFTPLILGEIEEFYKKKRIDIKLVEHTESRVLWHIGGDFMFYINVETGDFKIASAGKEVILNSTKENTIMCEMFLDAIGYSTLTVLIK